MTTIEVFKDSDLATQINNNPDKPFLNVNKGAEPKPDAKSYYHTTSMNIEGSTDPKKPFIRNTKNIKLTGTPKDPATDKNKNDDNGRKLILAVSESNSPEFATIARKTDKDVTKRVNELKESGEIRVKQPQGLIIINSPYSPNYSSSSQKKDENGKSMAGKPRVDPLVKIKVSFERYADKHPIKPLQGTAKTTILDYRTRRVEEVKNAKNEITKVINYDKATADGEEITAENAYKFITTNSEIMEGSRFIIEDVSNSSFGFSYAILANRLIINPGVEVDFNDRETANAEEIAEFERKKNEAQSQEKKNEPTTSATSSAPANAPATTSTTTSTNAPATTSPDVSGAIGDIQTF